MAQDPQAKADTWDENCIKAGGIPYDGDDYRKYKPKGKFEDIDTGGKDALDKLSLYTCEPKDDKDVKGVIIFIYDIFGWNKTTKNVFEFADLLMAQTSCRVIMPDFYRGNPWPKEKFPPQTKEEKDEFGQWWGTVASHDIVVKDVYEKLLRLKSVSGQNIGCIGFCLGGLEAIQLGSDSKTFKCVATLHAARINAELIQKLQVPIYYGPADGDFAIEKAQEAMKAKKDNDAITNASVFHYYKGQVHGFSAARGDFGKKETFQDVETAIKEISEFFGKNLK